MVSCKISSVEDHQPSARRSGPTTSPGPPPRRTNRRADAAAQTRNKAAQQPESMNATIQETKETNIEFPQSIPPLAHIGRHPWPPSEAKNWHRRRSRRPRKQDPQGVAETSSPSHKRRRNQTSFDLGRRRHRRCRRRNEEEQNNPQRRRNHLGGPKAYSATVSAETKQAKAPRSCHAGADARCTAIITGEELEALYLPDRWQRHRRKPKLLRHRRRRANPSLLDCTR